MRRAADIVDESTVSLSPTDESNGRLFIDRKVRKTLNLAALPAPGERLSGNVITRLKVSRIRLIGDQAHRSRHRTGTEQRALRTRERLNAGHIVNVDIQIVGNGRDRHFVHVDADQGLGPEMDTVATVGHATYIQLRLTRPVRLNG